MRGERGKKMLEGDIKGCEFYSYLTNLVICRKKLWYHFFTIYTLLIVAVTTPLLWTMYWRSPNAEQIFLLSYTTSIVIVYIAILSLCKEWDLAHYLYLLTSVSYTIRRCIFEIIIMLRNYFNLHNFRCKTWKCLAGKFLP